MKTQKSKVMNECCEKPNAIKEEAYSINLGCENCPFGELCCSEYYKNIDEYTKKY